MKTRLVGSAGLAGWRRSHAQRRDGDLRGCRADAAKRQLVAGASLGILAALALVVACAKPPKLGDPIRGLSAAERDQFERGRAEFGRVFTPETGLGPLFNANGCAECHEVPVPGGAGDEVEVHASAFRPEGSVCDPLAAEGGFVVQQHVTPALKVALGIDSEPVPPDATATGRRTTPLIFGFGLLDAVPDDEIRALAARERRDRPDSTARPNRFLDGRIGRFGRKANVPTLSEFVEGAFVAEQGITNPAVPTEETVGGKPLPAGVDPLPEPEIGEQALDRAIAFVRFLAPPAPKPLSVEAQTGLQVFYRIQCDGCHVPVIRTGASPVKALRHRKVAAYTDLLLHDMGPDLADICLGLATPSEFRTAPLMGLRFSKKFLHDGRAATIGEAIRMHGGEGAPSRRKFDLLPDHDRKALLEFLNSL